MHKSHGIFINCVLIYYVTYIYLPVHIKLQLLIIRHISHTDHYNYYERGIELYRILSEIKEV